jgi:hypothetical protein
VVAVGTVQQNHETLASQVEHLDAGNRFWPRLHIAKVPLQGTPEDHVDQRQPEKAMESIGTSSHGIYRYNIYIYIIIYIYTELYIYILIHREMA